MALLFRPREQKTAMAFVRAYSDVACERHVVRCCGNVVVLKDDVDSKFRPREQRTSIAFDHGHGHDVAYERHGARCSGNVVVLKDE